eukprot:scaffold80470_cov39-Cyclotella_meneghiniana.AAC.1
MAASPDDRDLTFLWFSDVHYDPYYSLQNGYSNEGTLCNISSLPATGRHGCDSPESLIRSALESAVKFAAAESSRGGPSFIVVT